MKIAVPATDGLVDGPGEGRKVIIFEVDSEGFQLVEEYDNPALTAQSARGIWMLRSALERGAEGIIVSGAGAHAFDFLQGKAKMFYAANSNVNNAIYDFMKGNLPELNQATHGHHHH